MQIAKQQHVLVLYQTNVKKHYHFIEMKPFAHKSQERDTATNCYFFMIKQ